MGEAGIALQLANVELDSAIKLQKSVMTDGNTADENLGESSGDFDERYAQFMSKFHDTAQPTMQHASGTRSDPISLLASQGALAFLEESTEDKCEQTKKIGMLNYNAMEAAAMQRDNHSSRAKKLRKQESSNLSGITSSAVILKNIETKVSNLQA